MLLGKHTATKLLTVGLIICLLV